MTSRYQSNLAEAHAVKDELRRRNAERVVRAKAESQFLKEMEARHSDPYGCYVSKKNVDAAALVSGGTTPRKGGGGGRRGSQQQFAASSHPQQVQFNHDNSGASRGASEAEGLTVGQPLDRLVEIHETVAADHDRRLMAKEAAESAARERSRARSLGRYHSTAAGNTMAVVVPEEEQFVEFTSRVEGCLAFCVCESQGGASVWTANTDGTLTIRNGTTLAAAVEIPRRADAVTPSVFHPTRDGYVWIGYTDGTVQIYDSNVFVLITEGQFHNDEVTSFVQMFDKRVVSGSRDGSLVRWEHEEKNFEAMSRVMLSDAANAAVSIVDTYGGNNSRTRRPQNEGIACLATQGFEVFVGCSFTGHLVSIHAQEEVQLGVFREAHSEGSDCTCVAVADGYLFSGYASQRVFVWNIESRRCLHSVNLHAIPVTITADFPNAPVNFNTTTNRLWISLSDSTVQVWSTQADERFNADLAITAFSGSGGVAAGSEGYASATTELLSLQTSTSWESMRAISIGSDGVSKIWVSLNSVGRKSRIDTVDNLASVLKHDSVQLDRIGATVQLFRQRQERRIAQLAEMMLRARRDAMLRAFYYRWQMFQRQRENERNLCATTAGLHILVPAQTLIFRYISKWYRWMASRRKANNTKKYALAMKPVQQERVHLLFLHRLKQFHATMRNHKNLETIMQLFVRNSKENLMRQTYFKWTEYVRKKQRNRKLIAVADALAVSTNLTRLRRFYAYWYRFFAQRMYLLKLGHQMMESAHRLGAMNLMRATYRKMQLYARRQKALRQLRFITAQNDFQRLTLVYFQKWMRYLHVMRANNMNDRLVMRQKYLESLRAQHPDLEALVTKKIALDRLRAEIAAVDGEIEKNKQGYDDAVTTIGTLQAELDAMRANKSREGETTQEQLFKLMSRLKAKALNFYTDLPLFNRIRESLKTSGQAAIVTYFLQQHMAVKRVVVEMTKKPHLGVNEKWPISRAQIDRSMLSHNFQPVMMAIKSMVICFDIMPKETRDSINTDQEIVLNGEHLITLLDACIAYFKKTRSTTPMRAVAGGTRATTPARR